MAERKPKPRQEAGDLPPITKEDLAIDIRDMGDLPPISEEDIKELTGGPMAAIGSFLNELTLDNLPALAGAASKLTGGDYVAERDRMAAQLKQNSEAFPKSAIAGKVAGFGASMAGGVASAKGGQKLIGSISPKLAELLEKSPIIGGAAEAALGGFGGGALQGTDVREGQFDPIADLRQRLESGATGAVLGAPIGVGAGILSKAGQLPIDMATRDIAEREAWLAQQIPVEEMRKTDALFGGDSRANRVTQAGKELGIVPTQGMLSDDVVKRNLEDSLANTPTAMGRMVGRQGRQVRQQLSNTAAGFLKDRIATADANYQAGTAIKEQLKSVLSAAYAPLKEAYGEISQQMGAIPLSTEGKKFAQKYWERRIRNSTTFTPDSIPRKVAEKYIAQIPRARTAENLRLMASEMKKEISTLVRRGEYVGELADVPGALERLAEREVIKAGFEATGRTAKGRELAIGLLDQKRMTDAQYRDLKEMFDRLRKNAGLKSQDTYGTLVDAIDDVPAEDLIRGLFDKNNLSSLKFFQANFPEAFETMRRHKVTEVYNKAKKSVAGEDLEFVDPKALLREIDNMPGTVRELLFGKQNMRKLEPLQVLTRALPGPVNPSGTSRGLEYIENFWNPVANLRDVGRWMMLNDRSPISPGRIPETVRKTAPPLAALGGGAVANSQQFMPEPRIEGFQVNQLAPVPPELMAQYLDSVSKDSSLSTIQKAKLKNLANKHGLAPTGGQGGSQ